MSRTVVTRTGTEVSPMCEHDLVDAVVVGYGPVGAVTAGLLGRAGLRTEVFETTSSVYHLPRAAHMDAEIMRILDELGVGDDVRAACAPVRGMHFVNANGDALVRFDVPDGAGFMFYQPDLERALRSAVDELAPVTVHLEHEVVGFVEHDDHIAVTARDLATGRPRTVRTRYLLAADGARSTIRKQLGVQVDDLCFDQPWLVVDTLLRRPVELPELVEQICDPARPTTFVPMCGSRRRWEFMLLPGEAPDELQHPARVAELLAPWVQPDDVEIVRAVVYTFHALLVRQWRAGRVFLLGDAAHQMPPFLGQGMCSGIRDAHNLVWKLALVHDGLASTRILDTYQAERAPHVRAIVELAVALGGVLQTTDPEVAKARDTAMLAPDAAGPEQTELPCLTAGLLTTGGGARVPDRQGGFELRAPTDPDLAPELDSWWRAIGGQVSRTDSRDAMLVRPDGYAFGTGPDGVALVHELHTALA